MENEKETKIQPGMRFYFKHLDWAKEQGGEIFAPLMTVLFGLAMDKNQQMKKRYRKP